MRINKIILATALLGVTTSAFAGNKDRSGQAGGTQLLIAPWAATNGLFGLNGAYVGGLEAMKLNVAGLAQTKKIEVGASHNTYLTGANTSIINAGFASRLSSRGCMGVNIMSVNMGEVPVTNELSPEPGVQGVYKPTMFNASIGYGHSFTKSIDAGVNFTFLSEGVANVRAGALGIDAGIMYKTGDLEQVHFGVFLRNVGSNMRFSGDGLSFNGTSPDDATKQITLQNRSERFQLPTQLVISSAYDFYLGNEVKMETAPNSEGTDAPAAETAVMTGKKTSRLTFSGSFISNSFIADNLGIGAEYAYREGFFARLGYRYESDINDAALSGTFFTGLSAGAGFQFKFGEGRLALDYAYRPTRIGAVHSVGLRFRN
jgi:hypothetical protein